MVGEKKKSCMTPQKNVTKYYDFKEMDFDNKFDEDEDELSHTT